MLKLLDGKPLRPCALLLGGFDGFHIGHRTLLERAKNSGFPVGLTSIMGGKPCGDVFTFPEREFIFAREGFSFAKEIMFTEEVKNTSAEAFLQALFAEIPVRAVYCGEDFRFGKGALGTPLLLRELAPCPVFALPLKKTGGEKIAVSRIKELLAVGEPSRLGELLGYDYFLAGEVEHGRQVGRTYGFPTLNLTLPKEKYPLREGVYSGYAETPAGTFPAVINVGARPTFGVTEKKAEAYLEGFHGDLYGAQVRLYPLRFLRPIMKFASAEALKEQLEKDRRSI